MQLKNLHRRTPMTLEHFVCWRTQHTLVAEGKVGGSTNSLQWQPEVRLKHLDFRSGQLCTDVWAEQLDAGCVSL